MPLAAPSAAALSGWIQSPHLDAARLSLCAARFSEDPVRTAVFDDFLLPERVAALHGLFREEGRFEEMAGLYGEGGGSQAVSREDYAAAAAERRFDTELQLSGPKPEFRLGQGFLTWLKLSRLFGSPPFLEFLRLATGVEAAGVSGVLLRIMQPRHEIRRHSDFQGGKRKLCLVLYLNPAWPAEAGGRFRQFTPDGGCRYIDPRPNRLLLFQPMADLMHDVEPITATAPERWACTVWLE